MARCHRSLYGDSQQWIVGCTNERAHFVCARTGTDGRPSSWRTWTFGYIGTRLLRHTIGCGGAIYIPGESWYSERFTWTEFRNASFWWWSYTLFGGYLTSCTSYTLWSTIIVSSHLGWKHYICYFLFQYNGPTLLPDKKKIHRLHSKFFSIIMSDGENILRL